MEFKDKLKELMVDNNIDDIKELATKTGICFGVLYGYLRGEELPDVVNACLLSDYFKSSIDYMFGISNSDNYTNKRNNKSFVQIYKELLKTNETNNTRVAKTLGISRSLYYEWIKGVSPKMKTIILLAKHFHVSIDYLIGKEY